MVAEFSVDHQWQCNRDEMRIKQEVGESNENRNAATEIDKEVKRRRGRDHLTQNVTPWLIFQ